MSGPVMMFHLILDRFAGAGQARIPEPALVMEDPAKVEAFMRAGREDGILAFTYVYNALQSLPVIRPGDTVLDLACGPANQLGVMARLHPEATFVGVDASPEMLGHGEAALERLGLGNVRLQEEDICHLKGVADASVDVVTSTLAFHHLNDVPALESCFSEIRRVLKPDGGVLLVDFGRLKRRQTQEFFATDRSDLQPELFTEDYRHSLRAAFSEEELRQASRVLGPTVQFYRTWMAPFMVMMRSTPRCTPDRSAEMRARELVQSLQPEQRRDLRDYALFFKFGGLPIPQAA